MFWSGVEAHRHVWWARDQQQLQVWSYLSKVRTGECGSACSGIWRQALNQTLNKDVQLFYFLLLRPCRPQRKNCSGTWKKVLPLSSSWSFWVTGLSFTTLKGLLALHLCFSFLFNLDQSTKSWIHHTHSVGHLAIDQTELKMDPFRKKEKAKLWNVLIFVAERTGWLIEQTKRPCQSTKDGWGQTERLLWASFHS